MNDDLRVSAVRYRDDTAGVRWITFNRPGASNAVTLADLDHVTRLLGSEYGLPKAVVFTGTGNRSFSAGMHLRAFSALDPSRARDFISRNRTVLATIRKATFPTIAAVNGYCLGTGLGIALASDIRIASENAVFGLPEIKVGVPSVCDIALLQQFVGLGKAKEMILTGDNYQATDPALAGLVNAIVPAEALIPETRKMLSRLTAHTTTVMAAQKRLFEAWQNTGLAAGIEMSIEVFSNVFSAEETTLQAEKHSGAVGRKAR